MSDKEIEAAMSWGAWGAGITIGEARMALSALEAAGYVVVLKEPTEAMIEAGVEAMLASETCGGEVTNIYRAMIAAGEKP